MESSQQPTCLCSGNYSLCEKCTPTCRDEFKKLVELKDSGLSIYVYNDQKDKGDKTNKNINYEEKKKDQSKKSFVIYNSDNKPVQRSTYCRELNSFSSDCNDCETIMQQLRALLSELNDIKDKEVLGICEHCALSNMPVNCKRCAFLANKFLMSKMRHMEERFEQFRNWLANVKNILMGVLEKEVGNKLHSEVSTDEMQRLIQELRKPIPMRQPVIRDFPGSLQDATEALDALTKNQELLNEILTVLDSGNKANLVMKNLRKLLGPHVPQELLDKILANLKGDKLTVEKLKQILGANIANEVLDNLLAALGEEKISTEKPKPIEPEISELELPPVIIPKRSQKTSPVVTKPKTERSKSKSSEDSASKTKEDEFAKIKSPSDKRMDQVTTDLIKKKKKPSSGKSVKRDISSSNVKDAKTDISSSKSKVKDAKTDIPSSKVKDAKTDISSSKSKVKDEKTDISSSKVKDAKTDISSSKSKVKDAKTDISSSKVKDAKTDISSSKSNGKDEKTDISSSKVKDAKTDISASKSNVKDAKTEVSSSKVKVKDEKTKDDNMLQEMIKKALKSQAKKKAREKTFIKSKLDLTDSDKQKQKKDTKKPKKLKKVVVTDHGKLTDALNELSAKAEQERKLRKKLYQTESDDESFFECETVYENSPSEKIEGIEIVPYKRHLEKNLGKIPMLYQVNDPCIVPPPPVVVPKEKPSKLEKASKIKYEKEEPQNKGILHYQLSKQEFIEKGWTQLPTERVMRKMNIFKMVPATPMYDWFMRHKHNVMLFYDTGEKLAEIDPDGHGRWYYRNQVLALDFYKAKEELAESRYVIYSSGEKDKYGRPRPITVLASFDQIGNGIVYDHNGHERLKYNQSEGIVIDDKIGPPGKWKWHNLNDPPVYSTVFWETFNCELNPKEKKKMFLTNQDSFKDDGQSSTNPTLLEEHEATRAEMLVIEHNNLMKEQSEKLLQRFKRFEIKPKCFRINECFSLKILDQTNVWLQYTDGPIILRHNLGLILKNNEIIHIDLIDHTEVGTPFDKRISKSDSIKNLLQIVKDVKAKTHGIDLSNI